MPARCAARQRRSPAMISNMPVAPRAGRTTIGWMMPRSLIEAASSSSSASAKWRRGLRGLGCRNSMATRRWPRAAARSARSSPLPCRRSARRARVRGASVSALLPWVLPKNRSPRSPPAHAITQRRYLGLILRSVRRTRLEGWPQTLKPVAILRDAALRTAPQDEVEGGHSNLPLNSPDGPSARARAG